MFNARQHLYGDFVFEVTFTIVPMVLLHKCYGHHFLFLQLRSFSHPLYASQFYPFRFLYHHQTEMFTAVVVTYDIEIFVHNVYTVLNSRMKQNDTILAHSFNFQVFQTANTQSHGDTHNSYLVFVPFSLAVLPFVYLCLHECSNSLDIQRQPTLLLCSMLCGS